jgi:hypothetical protein
LRKHDHEEDKNKENIEIKKKNKCRSDKEEMMQVTHGKRD